MILFSLCFVQCCACHSSVTRTALKRTLKWCQLLVFISFSYGNIQLLMNPINNKTNENILANQYLFAKWSLAVSVSIDKQLDIFYLAMN